MSAVQAHFIRPGFVLRWDSGRLDPATWGEAHLLFLFSLQDDAREAAANRMVLLRREGLAQIAAEPAPSFHVALALSAAALDELLAEDKTTGARRVRELAAGEGDAVLPLPLTPGARLAVESIRRCPFVGAIRAMALTGRSNDLLLEFFTGLAAVAEPRTPVLARSVVQQVQAAADVLARELEEPPTLAALARQVGLSETTLKRGFHQVFGATVFGYLRERRMERARALLQSGEATVLEAAALVGYSNPSNFASAFRRQFGVNPKTFQMTARRQE